MQRIRLTHTGALNCAMNRGHGGEKVFSGSGMKKMFINILAETYRNLKIKIIAYCLMDNHYLCRALHKGFYAQSYLMFDAKSPLRQSGLTL